MGSGPVGPSSPPTSIRSEAPARGSTGRSNGQAAAADRRLGAAHQAFWLLRITFTVAADLFRLDKFFNWSVDWPDYLAGWINSIAPGSGQDFMHFVGAVEILAGFLVLLAPRIGSFVVAAWLAGIVINLLTKKPPQYYDIALRDFGLMLGALTLGRLSLAVVPARKSGVLPDRPLVGSSPHRQDRASHPEPSPGCAGAGSGRLPCHGTDEEDGRRPRGAGQAAAVGRGDRSRLRPDLPL